MTPPRTALSLLALTLSPAAFAASSPPILVEVVGVREVAVGLDGVRLTLDAEVERTRGLPLVLRGLDYTVVMGDQTIASSWTPEQRVRLKRGEPTVVSIPVKLKGEGLMSVLGSTLRTGELPPIRVEGQARGRVFVVPFSHGFAVDLDDLIL